MGHLNIYWDPGRHCVGLFVPNSIWQYLFFTGECALLLDPSTRRTSRQSAVCCSLDRHSNKMSTPLACLALHFAIPLDRQVCHLYPPPASPVVPTASVRASSGRAVSLQRGLPSVPFPVRYGVNPSQYSSTQGFLLLAELFVI